MPVIRYLIGISGSMKTTLAKEILKNEPDTIRVNRDDVRLQLFGVSQNDISYYERKDFKNCEMLVSDTIQDIMYNALNKNLNVIIDNTNLNKKYLDEVLFNYNHLADIALDFVDSSVEDAVARVKARNGEDFDTTYISRQQNDYKKLKTQLHGKPLFYPRRTELLYTSKSNPSAFLFDIDGTLALKGDRDIFDDSKLHLDTLIEPVVNVLKAVQAVGHRVIYLSGRQDSCKESTTQWLKDNGIWFEDSEIHMRKAKDGRKDSIVKEELFLKFIAPRFNVQGIFDDREQVTRNWSKLGIFCFDVNQTKAKF